MTLPTLTHVGLDVRSGGADEVAEVCARTGMACDDAGTRRVVASLVRAARAAAGLPAPAVDVDGSAAASGPAVPSLLFSRVQHAPLPPLQTRAQLPLLFESLGLRSVVEVGVLRGEFAESLVRYWPGLRTYVGVDVWAAVGDTYRDLHNTDDAQQLDNYETTRRRLAPYPHVNVTLHRMTSEVRPPARMRVHARGCHRGRAAFLRAARARVQRPDLPPTAGRRAADRRRQHGRRVPGRAARLLQRGQ